ncbi:MAG: sulfatase family protein [Thermoleophilaceae bacterium]
MSGGLRRRDFVRATGAGLAGAALAGAGCRGSKGRGAPAQAGPRNIVLIVIDTLRPDHLGCYGNDWVRTPNIDALAKQSLRFTRVFPEAMPTVPARRSILTGRRVYPFRGWEPWEGLAKRAGWSPIIPGTPTLPTILRKHGYWTAYVSDNPFLTHAEVFAPFRDSIDHYARVMGQRGVLHPADSVPRSEAVRRLPPVMRTEAGIRQVRQYMANNGGGRVDEEQAAARVFSESERLLGEAARRKPFFMVVDSFDPHEYWAPLREDLELYADPDYHGADIADVRYTWSDYLTRAQLRHLRATYAASVTAVDRWLGHFLDGLRRRGLDRNTVVALVSDHGIYLGEHRLTGKSDSYLHPELIQVPLLLRDPDGRGAGQASDYYATTIDLAPTLTGMAKAPPSGRFEGTDLSPLLAGAVPAEEREFAYGGYGNFSYIRDERWALVVRNDNGWRLFYDLEADPRERRDVAAKHPKVVHEMWRRLLGEVGRRPPRYSLEWTQRPSRALAG